jgi:hypothetical protein
MRIVFGGLGLFLLLGACAASAPPTLAGKDVACLRASRCAAIRSRI